MRALVGLCSIALAATGCGLATTFTASSRSGAEALEAPPPVRLVFATGALELEPYSFCYLSGCADGMPPADPPDVGAAPDVRIQFPLDDWRFEAMFQVAGEQCGRVRTAGLRPADNGDHLLVPVGPPATYDVTLVGRGKGDLVTTFRWTTQSAGPLERPKAELAVLADHDGEISSYGVELAVSNLAHTPAHATATVTVTAANGRSSTFHPAPGTQNCLPEGTVAWNGSEARGLAVAKLGPAPFSYDVVLTLDGARHTATARWPEDVMNGNEPAVRLHFTPPLPAER